MTQAEPRKSRSMRLTERFLLPFTGPAEVGDSRRRTPVTEEQRRRATELDAGLTRLTRPDGSTYLVARGTGDEAEGREA